MTDIPNVEGKLLFPGQGVASVHLRPANNAGNNFVGEVDACYNVADTAAVAVCDQPGSYLRRMNGVSAGCDAFAGTGPARP